jgi:hypothetical protein
MKRIGIVGLCLAAMFAMSAVAASSAFAASGQPAWFECAKVAKVTVKYTEKGKEKSKAITEGKYSNAACTELAPTPGKYISGPEGKYELQEGVAKGKKAKTKDGIGILNTVIPTLGNINDKVECASSKSENSVANAGGRGFVSDLVVHFSKCKSQGEPCQTSTKKEEIVTNALAGELGYINKGGDVVGLELWNEANPGTGYLAEFTCTKVAAIRTLGSVIGEVTGDVGAISKTSTTTYASSTYFGAITEGPFTWEPLVNIPSFEGEAVDVLSTEFNTGSGYEPSGGLPSGQNDTAANTGEALGIYEGV